MKKMFKVMLLVLCAALLVAGSVLGTLAYLKMQTSTVTNTFTVGKVAITLQEYEINADGSKSGTTTTAGVSNIKLIPGREINKHPFITVAQGSEKCYLFVKIENNIPTAYGQTNLDTNKWECIDTVNNVYAYVGVASGIVDASTSAQVVDVFTKFICSNTVEQYTTTANLTINVTAYAVQSEGFANAQVAWAASGFGA